MHNNFLIRKLPIRLLFIFIIICLSCSTIHAQDSDSTYIQSYDRHVGVGLTMSQNMMTLSSLAPDYDMTYRSNFPLRIGIKLNLQHTSLYLSYGSKMDFLSSRVGGKSSAFAFELHHYDRHFNYHLNINHYKGFHHNSPALSLYPKLAIGQIGLNAEYVANSHFSYEAVTEQNERQKKSCGSFLAGVGTSYTHISNDNMAQPSNSNLFIVGVNAGYAYTWVISRHWFVTPSALLWMNVGAENDKHFSTREFIASPSVMPSATLGYTLHNWSFGASYTGNYELTAVASNKQSLVNNNRFQFSFAYRFGVKGLEHFKNL